MLSLLVALTAPALAARLDPCPAEQALIELAPSFPIPSAETPIRLYRCQIELDLPGDDGLAARDELWTSWTGWLSVQGYSPANHDQHMPWNEVRWRQFTKDGATLELQVRRPWGRSGDWMVLMTPVGART